MTDDFVEVELVLLDDSKVIAETVAWTDAANRPPTQQFVAEVESDFPWGLSVNGWCNPLSQKLNLSLFVHLGRERRRIFAFNVGEVAHRNPDGQFVTGSHAHLWSPELLDREATPRPELPSWNRPLDLWSQFCAESNITHLSVMVEPAWKRDLQA